MINENPDVQVYISGEQLCITCRISELSVLLGGKSQHFPTLVQLYCLRS